MFLYWLLKKKSGLLLSAIYLIALSIFFWTQSRYPDLWVKSESGPGTPLEDTIAFEAILSHSQNELKFQEILISFVNWWYTNLKWMIFGIFFAIGIMSFLSYIDKQKIPRNTIFSSVFWILQWSVLWLCANCATPIGKSFFSSGLSPLVWINTILASPMFNVIGLWLMFDIFPKHVVLTKVFFYVIIFFIFVPIIFWEGKNKSKIVCESGISQNPFYKEFFKNSLYMVLKTVPWMILAGLLWVAIVSFIPIHIFSVLEINIVNVLLVSFISFLIPVPMFFDLIFSGILYNWDLPQVYTYILLFNLGAFSIYPILVLKQDVWWKKLAYLSGIFIFGSPILAYTLTNFM